MSNKRIQDLPLVTSATAGDKLAIDGATTRSIAIEDLLGDNLVAVQGLTSAADKGIQFTGAGTAATYDLTVAGKALLDDADAASQRGTLGLVIGTDVQAFDADLTALSALGGTNTIYYRSGSAAWSAVTIGTNLTFSGGTLAAENSDTAASISYDHTTSGLTASDVQAAIDELKTLIGTGGTGVSFNDSYVDAENAFWAMTICPATASQQGNSGLWNPINSAKLIRVDQMGGAIDGAGATSFGADIRIVPHALTTTDENQPFNKKPNGRSSAVSCVYQASTPPGKPAQEIWLGRKDEDHTYTFNPSVAIPPGYCIFFGTADQNVAAISSWQYREETYTETYITQATGTAVSDMTNPSNAFDGSQTTYADLTGSSFYIGKNWGGGVTKTVSRFRVASPDGRSFSGANPARSYTWYLEGSSDGSSWTQIDTGSYSETGTGATKDYLDKTTTSLSTAYQYHRVRLVDGSGSGTHRVAEVELWAR